MRIQDKLVPYLEYCEYRKELDKKTIKAYRIDLRQYFAFICCDEPDKEKIEAYIIKQPNIIDTKTLTPESMPVINFIISDVFLETSSITVCESMALNT